MTIYALVQAAVQPDLSHLIPYGAGLIVVGTMGWVIKTCRDVKIAVTRLTDCLFGYTGTNGLNSDVKTLREDVDRILDRR